MLSLHYHELMKRIEEHEKTNIWWLFSDYLMVNDYKLDKSLDKTKITISIEKFDDTKILINTDNKVPDYITLRNVVILITCIITLKNVVILITCNIKHDGEIYLRIFLEEAFYTE